MNARSHRLNEFGFEPLIHVENQHHMSQEFVLDEKPSTRLEALCVLQIFYAFWKLNTSCINGFIMVHFCATYHTLRDWLMFLSSDAKTLALSVNIPSLEVKEFIVSVMKQEII